MSMVRSINDGNTSEPDTTEHRPWIVNGSDAFWEVIDKMLGVLAKSDDNCPCVLDCEMNSQIFEMLMIDDI